MLPDGVAPVRERGLKFSIQTLFYQFVRVAPVRERGLKSVKFFPLSPAFYSRSREGAWIEIQHYYN